MKKMYVLACFGIVLLTWVPGVTQVSSAPFSITIRSLEPDVKSGSPIAIRIKLANLTDREVTLIETNPYCDYAVEVHNESGNLIPETGFKRSLHCSESDNTIHGRRKVLRIQPRGEAEGELTISEVSEMSEPGKYDVQVQRNAPKELGGMQVKSNWISINVTK